MSYEKVKSITPKIGEGKVEVMSACNNVRPLIYSKWSFTTKNGDELFETFIGILDGEFHIQKSVSKKIRFAMLMVYKYLEKHKLDSYEIYKKAHDYEVPEGATKEEKEELYCQAKHNAYDELFKVFEKYYESYKDNGGKYIIKVGCNYLFSIAPTCIRRWDRESAKEMDLVTALENVNEIRCCYSNYQNCTRIEKAS